MHAPLAAATAIKRRTITLTNRAPIVINEDDWEILAEGQAGWEHPAGADHEYVSVEFHVRERKRPKREIIHCTGRFVIHANYDYYNDAKEEGQRVRVGRTFFTDSANEVWKQMRGVAEELVERIDLGGHKKYVTHALDACFAKLGPHEA